MPHSDVLADLTCQNLSPWWFPGQNILLIGLCSYQGVAGISPNVKLMACKFLDNKGNGYISDAIRCMSYALQVEHHSFPSYSPIQ